MDIAVICTCLFWTLAGAIGDYIGSPPHNRLTNSMLRIGIAISVIGGTAQMEDTYKPHDITFTAMAIEFDCPLFCFQYKYFSPC